MTINQSIARSGASPVGEPQSPAGSRLIRATAASWTHERKQEAREAGYRVVFDVENDTLIASFWNGSLFCYSREWTP